MKTFKQTNDEIISNTQRIYTSKSFKRTSCCTQPYGMLQDAEHLTNPAHISPVNVTRSTRFSNTRNYGERPSTDEQHMVVREK